MLLNVLELVGNVILTFPNFYKDLKYLTEMRLKSEYSISQRLRPAKSIKFVIIEERLGQQ